MPAYQSCGEIVWLCKRQARTFAFKCIYCQDQQEMHSSTFKDFKRHLESQHPEMFLQQMPEQIVTRALRSGSKQDQLMDSDPLEDSVKQELISDDEVKALEGEQLKLPSEGDHLDSHSSESDESLSSLDEEDPTSPPTDTSHFWLIENHPIMLALIDQLEQQRLLWDLGMLAYRNYKQRSEALQKICQNLNDQFSMQFRENEMNECIKKLRQVYGQEKRRQDLEAAPPPAWFFERLGFLAKGVRRKAFGQLQAHLSHEQNLKLIELYRECKNNWDMHDMTCRLRHVRQAAKDKLLELCRAQLQIPLDPSLLQRYIRRLRKAFVQEKTCRIKNGELDTDAGRCRYYEQLKFLEQHLGPFQCDLCQQVLSSVDMYKVHRASHDNSLPFVCPTCGRGFSRSGNCTIHLRRHTRDYNLACDECGKRFPTTTDLQVHRRCHTGEKPYCCDICGSRFSSGSFFIRHRRRHEQRHRGKCHICGKTFFEQAVLNDHIKAHLNVRDKECDICHKTFTSAKYLRQHKEIHAPNKRYICKICNKGFAQYAGLSGHMKSHGTVVRGLGTKETELMVEKARN